jgi:hypothetical protein
MPSVFVAKGGTVSVTLINLIIQIVAGAIGGNAAGAALLVLARPATR